MMSWNWASPFYLGAALVAVGVIFLLRYWVLLKEKQFEEALGTRNWLFLISGISIRKRTIKFYLLAFSLIPLFLALARPQFGDKKETVKSLGVEMMILFDVSQSMLAEDISPSRIEFAKKEMGRLLESLPGSKFGLIAFAGSAALVSPITTDTSAMKMFIESLSTDVIASQGTEFKMALEQAESSFDRGGQTQDQTSKATRVILVVSDGEDQEPGALETAEKLAEKGIRIFSIAIGTEAGGPIPLRDPNGFLRGYKKNNEGQVIQTTSQGKVLKTIAEAGKGSFYTATFAGTYIKDLVDDINQLEKAEFDSQVIVNYEERYQIFIWLALILLFSEIFLSVRKKRSLQWRGRFETEGS